MVPVSLAHICFRNDYCCQLLIGEFADDELIVACCVDGPKAAQKINDCKGEL